MAKDLVPVFNKVLDHFIGGKYGKEIKEAAKLISLARGIEKDKELQAELVYWTKVTGQDFSVIQII